MSFLTKKSSSVDLKASAYENPSFQIKEPTLLSYISVPNCSQYDQQLSVDFIHNKMAADFHSEPQFLLQWTNLRVAVPSQQGQRLVLDEVSGQINNRQIICILGSSGSGKSTLLNCIAGK